MGRIKDPEKIQQNAKAGICSFCGKVCKNQNSLRQHQVRCALNPNRRAVWLHNEHWQEAHKLRNLPKPEKVNRICRFCNKVWETTSSGLKYHESHCKLNPERLKPFWEGKHHSEESKRKISETGKKNQSLGGYRQGSGRGKKGWYKGYFCDSSWELAYVIYNLEHEITFKRNEEFFPYEFNGEKHNYKPDFIENGVFVEIKGYFNEQVEAKEKAFPFELKYLDKETIKPYLKYVEETYGKDFTRLYE